MLNLININKIIHTQVRSVFYNKLLKLNFM